LNGRVETQVEELGADRVRVSVEVPVADIQHAVDHAASDLASTTKIPGFRKGKVPLQVLIARVGKERVYSEAVESHIGGWLRNALSSTRIRPVGRPEYEYDLPESADSGFHFTATVPVQPKVDVADWTQLEVPAAEPEVPEEVVEAELEALRATIAELAPVDGRSPKEGDVVVVDLVGPDGKAQRDYVVEIGDPRLLEEVGSVLLRMHVGQTEAVEWEDEDGPGRLEVTLKEIKEKVLPPLDDELARAASEFDTLDDLRAGIESRLGGQIAEELDTQFRVAAVDALVDASGTKPEQALVDARATELLAGFVRSLDNRGLSLDTYLAVSGRTREELVEQLRAEAERSLARELVLETVADQLGLEVTDEDLAEVMRQEGEDPETVEKVLASPARESLKEDIRLRRALDRIVADVKRIPIELARAREQLWTPEKEKAVTDTKLWTPGQEDA
jgi:trigger factor